MKVLGNDANEMLRSGATQIARGVSSGVQNVTTGNPDVYPLSQRVPKIEADIQCAGEAEYVGDVMPVPGELHGAFVLSKRARCDIDTVDTSVARVIIKSIPLNKCNEPCLTIS